MGAAGAENCNFPGLGSAVEINEQGQALAAAGAGAVRIYCVLTPDKHAFPASNFPHTKLAPF